jgi:hypothetical protein
LPGCREPGCRVGLSGLLPGLFSGCQVLDHEHSRQADGTRYPGVREQVQGHLVGPGCEPGWDPVLGLMVGSYQGCSEALHAGLHGLAREGGRRRRRRQPTAKLRQMGVRTERARGAGDLLRSLISISLRGKIR